jgi:hypothetical protein
MKKVVKDTNKEMKHYLGLLNEMHGENLKGIKDGFEILNKKFDRHAKILDSHTEMIGVVMEDVFVLKTDVSTLKTDMTIIKEDISIIKSDLKKRVDYDEFLSLVKRVQKIEAKI